MPQTRQRLYYYLTNEHHLPAVHPLVKYYENAQNSNRYFSFFFVQVMPLEDF
eukprot:UN11832